MSKGCPYCDNKDADSELDYKCPECGHAFWKSKKAFFKRESKGERRLPHVEKPQGIKVKFWLRTIVSTRFRDLLLKGFLASLPLIAFMVLDSFANDRINDSIGMSIFCLMLIYWVLIIAGYIYGNFKNTTVLSKSRAQSALKPILVLKIFPGQTLFISFEFRKYILKVTVALVILGLISEIQSANGKADSGLWVLFVIYIAVLTIGYAYGYIYYNDKRKLIALDREYAPTEGPDDYISKIHCHHCGKKIDDDSNFCIFCGSEITRKK